MLHALTQMNNSFLIVNKGSVVFGVQCLYALRTGQAPQRIKALHSYYN